MHSVSIESPDTNPVNFDDEQFTSVKRLLRLFQEKSFEALQQMGNNLRVITELDRHNSSVLGWRVSGNIGEIAIHGKKNTI